MVFSRCGRTAENETNVHSEMDLPLSVHVECGGSGQERVLISSLLLACGRLPFPPVVVAIVMQVAKSLLGRAAGGGGGGSSVFPPLHPEPSPVRLPYRGPKAPHTVSLPRERQFLRLPLSQKHRYYPRF